MRVRNAFSTLPLISDPRMTIPEEFDGEPLSSDVFEAAHAVSTQHNMSCGMANGRILAN